MKEKGALQLHAANKVSVGNFRGRPRGTGGLFTVWAWFYCLSGGTTPDF